MMSNSIEAINNDRFSFGDNWLSFLKTVDDKCIERAMGSLIAALGVETLRGRTFLDLGCGSGLFSLAAHRLGAKVRSFDYDPASVAACVELRRRYAQDGDWTVEQGSILDETYVRSLGVYDVVYAWGVLHHTGAMWRALEAATSLVAPKGSLYTAIYNDQGPVSRLWWLVKRRYVRSGALTRWMLVLAGGTYFSFRTAAGALLRAADLCPPRDHIRQRGMSAWHDVVDWIGGFPFEVAAPEKVFEFLRERGFELRYLRTCKGRHGCNEYVFVSPRP
ncbi:class I SAM-dependent methyltransferase [Nonomuraea sp. 3N208]|uniref:class I SAM-dependent methyltransferase n=1 Tax=Nonomuraea sp. 3N208 TaxID=3457421 RepID=UPI003FCFC511